MTQAILALLLEVLQIFTQSCWRKHQGTTVPVPHWPFKSFNSLNDRQGGELQVVGIRFIARVPYFVTDARHHLHSNHSIE